MRRTHTPAGTKLVISFSREVTNKKKPKVKNYGVTCVKGAVAGNQLFFVNSHLTASLAHFIIVC